MGRYNLFTLPIKLILFEEIVVTFLLPLTILVAPIVFAVLIFYYCRITHGCPSVFPHIIGIFIVISWLLIYIKGFVKSSLTSRYQPYGFKFYRNLVHRSYKKFILNNLRCPHCNGRFADYRKIRDDAIWFCDFAYICSSCGREYVPENVIETDHPSIRTLWTLKEVKRSVYLDIKDVYSKPARFGKGETLYIRIVVKNRSKSKVWICYPYVVTDKGKKHTCISDRCIDRMESAEEGSSIDIPPNTTMDLIAHTCDSEEISDPLLPGEVPLKFTYSTYYDKGPNPPLEYSIEIPEKLIRKLVCGRRDSNPGRGLGRP